MALSILHSILGKRIHNAASAYQKFDFYGSSLVNKIGKKALNSKNHQFMLLYTSQHFYKKRKTAEEKKSARIIQYAPKSKAAVVEIWKHMTVSDVANALGKDTDHVFEVMTFVDNSVKYTRPNSVIDNWQVVQDIVKKSGYKFRVVGNPHHNNDLTDMNKDIIKSPLPDSSELVKRPPIVTIMGHVDHGKTTLLDSLRHTSVAASEFGGITQHIGAFSVNIGDDCPVTFLDTPGHAAFTAMRARGADVTDIVVLVVAADDGVMEQTIESIRMANEANVPIIVAINKIDRPNSDINRTKKMLLMSGIQVEDEGGDVQVVPISALHGTNLHQLVEAIVLQAEIMELKGDPTGMVEGVIIESEIDPHRGKLATAIIKRGTLRKGTILVAGIAWCKVRAMFDSNGLPLQEAGLSTAVQIIGWREFVSAGEEILEVESEKRANEVIRWRANKKLEQKADADSELIMIKAEEHRKAYKEQLKRNRLMGRYKTRPTGPRQKEISQDDGMPKVSIVLKGDVDGSVEAILDVLETYNSNLQCKLDVVHYGVGNVNENDIELAEVFNASIYTFNTEVPNTLSEMVKSKNITIRHHKVIYRLIEDLKKEINLKLPKKEVEVILGEANVLQEFIVTENRKKVPVAGCRCATGVLKKGALFRLLRDGHVEYEGPIESMRHLKSEVESIKKDTECGICLADYSVRFQPGDTLVCYEVQEESQVTDWNPGF